MSFQFRFASLLQLHRRRRDQVGAEVGKANQAINQVNGQYNALLEERKQLLQQAGQTRVGTISIDAVLAHGRYDVQLQSDMHALRETRSKLEQELERRQQALVAVEADVKRFERLEENERFAYRKEKLRREQAASDEATSTRYLMERRKA